MTGQEEEEEEKVEEQATPSKPLDFGSPDMDGNNNGRPQGQQQHDEEASYAVSEDSSSSCSVEAAPIQPISFQSVLSSQEGSTRSQNQPRSSKRAVFVSCRLVKAKHKKKRVSLSHNANLVQCNYF